MRKWQLRPGDRSNPLVSEDVVPRALGLGEARIRVRAASLNFRDLLALRGTYPTTREKPVYCSPTAPGKSLKWALASPVLRSVIG